MPASANSGVVTRLLPRLMGRAGRPNVTYLSDGRNARSRYLSPHPGLLISCWSVPRFTPWATFCRASGAFTNRTLSSVPESPAKGGG
jgi:hypothetical protein